MKQQDIDKKIGMPDVDKEWTRFERGVIDQKTTSRKSLYWGIGIAASIALVAGIFLLNHDAEKQQAIAQQTTHTTETPLAADHHTAVAATDQSVAFPAKDEPFRTETELRPRAEMHAQRKHKGYLQDHIAELDFAPSSADLGAAHSIRITGSGHAHRKDSIVVVVNGEILPDSIGLNIGLWNVYINRQQQMINTINIYKGDRPKEQFKARYGFLPSADALIEITTTTDTLSEIYMQQHPDLRTQRRRIEGYVISDDGKPLTDAWVSLSKYEQGTATDNTGHFIFWIPRTGKTLTIYCDGYETISDMQPSDTLLTIRMKPLVNPIKTKEKGAIMIRGAIPQS